MDSSLGFECLHCRSVTSQKLFADLALLHPEDCPKQVDEVKFCLGCSIRRYATGTPLSAILEEIQSLDEESQEIIANTAAIASHFLQTTPDTPPECLDFYRALQQAHSQANLDIASEVVSATTEEQTAWNHLCHNIVQEILHPETGQ